MRTMIDLGRERGPMGMQMITTATTMDCSNREVGLRRSLRSLLDCIVPACCGAGFEPHPDQGSNYSPDSCSSSSAFSSDTDSPSPSSALTTNRSLSSSCTTVKGTFFGLKNGRVSFCLQDDIHHHHHRRTPSRRLTTTTLASFSHPLLLLEFAIPTSYLAKEMQHGLLRIALVEEQQQPKNNDGGIFEVPVWSMYCNGRKVGYATRRKMTAADSATLTRMQSISVGAGVLPAENEHRTNGNNGIMYLRASFHRIIGSSNSESFHMINPDQDGRSVSNPHSTSQELSIYLLRSSS
ncbi:protein MIZU-KUSSEI 1 [Rutidosis leptorrhynchoides]|uniref:protein MIZU-KUSSEI 1 n=1 Tax=Rutidosis leptorrhynchoides TaxID=125765 RepID=UPI003A99C132